MAVKMSKLKICALLLGLVFLAAQFHFCTDFSAGHNRAHFCPYCASSATAIIPPSPSMGIMLGIVRLEISLSQTPVSEEVLLSLSSRAPPTV